MEAGDLKTATAGFTRDGCFLTRDATAINGRERIAEVLGQWVDRRPQFRIEPASLLVLGDLVLANERWTMCFQPDGSSALREETSATLLLRWVESEWKLALLAPWGWEGLGRE